MLFATYSNPTLQIEKDGKITEIDHVRGLYYQTQNGYTQEKIGYIGEFSQSGTTTVYDEDHDGKALITVTYPGVATLSDGSSADLVIKYTKVTIQTDIDTKIIGKGTYKDAEGVKHKITYEDAEGVKHTINGPLGIIDANQLYVDRAFIYEQGNTTQGERAFGDNKSGVGVEIEYEVSVEKDGNTVDGTILWTANDLDVHDRYTGEKNTDGSKVPYAESMEILEGAKSYAVTPYYDHTTPKNPLGFQIDSKYYNSTDSTANGVRFFTASRLDGSSYDSGFSALISSGGDTKMRWTGSKENWILMGTVLFDTTVINQIRMSHGTGGGIYLENYDGDNKCSVEKIEGIAAHGLYAEATLTAVPEVGYRVKAIYVDDTGDAEHGYDSSKAGKTKYEIKYTYDKDSGTYKVDGIVDPNDNNKVVKIGTDGKYTMSNGIVFEINADGTVDVTMKRISNFKHVHADFEADYFFYKTWVGDKEPTSLKLTATPYSYKYSFKFDHDEDGTESTFTMEGNTIKGAGQSWTVENNIWTIDPEATDVKQWRVAGDKVYRMVADGDDEPLVTMSKKMVKAPGVDPVEFTVDKNSPLIYKKSDDKKTWYITYPSEGAKQGEVIPGTITEDNTSVKKADKDYAPMPIEKTATDHGNNHVDRLYWFVSEEAPGWALEEYSNANAKASGVVSGDYYEDTNWYKDSTADTSDAQKEIDKSEASAFMAVEREGGEIINAPAVIIKANKEWKDDADNAFVTRRDIVMHLDAQIKVGGTTTTVEDILPPQKIASDAAGDALTVTWGDKQVYPSADPDKEVKAKSSDIPQGDEKNPITYTRGKEGEIDFGYHGSDGSNYYVNELPVTDAESNKYEYIIRETLADGSDVAKDDPDSGLIGYKTEYKNPANQDDNQTGTDQYDVPIYTGPVKNTLETVDVEVTKNWIDERTDHTPDEILGLLSLYVKDGTQEKKAADISQFNNIEQSITPDSGSAGSYTVKWTKLPRYVGYDPTGGTGTNDNREVSYYVKETQANGYAAPIYTNVAPNASETGKALDKGTITNSQLASVTVTKKWDDELDKTNRVDTTYSIEGTWSDAAGEHTYSKDEGSDAIKAAMADKTIAKNDSAAAKADAGSVTWSDLPAYSTNGTKIIYKVTEQDSNNLSQIFTMGKAEGVVNGNKNYGTGVINDTTGVLEYKFEITNTLKTIDVTATKEWDDNNDQDGKRDAVTFTISPNNAALPAGETKDKTIAKGSTGSSLIVKWSGLPAYHNGSEVDYTVTESALTGYTATITPTKGADGNVTVVVKNTHIPETGDILVKKAWVDDRNRDGLRDSQDYSVTLYKTIDGNETTAGVEDGIVPVTDGDVITYTGLPVYADGGKPITYSVKEKGANTDYSASSNAITLENGNGTITVTNTREPERTEISVTKVWNDMNDNDGVRPDDITVELWHKYTSETVTTDPETGEEETETEDVDEKLQDVTLKPTDASDPTAPWTTETITNLFVNEPVGAKVTYYFKEPTVAGYDDIAITNDGDGNFTITNTRDVVINDPHASPAETENWRGVTQYQDMTDHFWVDEDTTLPDNKIERITLVDPETGEDTVSVTVPGEGTYTIDDNGKITFVPDPDFVGKTSGVTVRGYDSNGKSVDTTYTPTVKMKVEYIDPLADDLDTPVDQGETDKDVKGKDVTTTYEEMTGTESKHHPGYRFDGWDEEEVKDPTDGSIKIVRTAKYTPMYKIVYDANGGDGVMADDDYTADDPTMPSKKNTFTREGYDFVGFKALNEDGTPAKDENGNEYPVFDSVEDFVKYFEGKPGGTTLTLQAQWEPKIWVRYIDEDGETVYMDKTYFSKGDDEPKGPDDPKKTGYTFTGWDRSVDDDGNITYVAKWEPEKYTIKYDPNGGEGEMDDQHFTGEDTEAVSKENEFTRDGYTFEGFKAKDKEGNYIKDAAGNDVIFKDPADFIEYLHAQGDGGEITLEAQWKKLPWATWIDPATGRTIKVQTTFNEDGTEPPAPEDPTRDGYTFTGWDREVDDEGNVTYKARWTPNTYNVTYVDPATGRIIQDTVTIPKGDPECDAPEDPTRDGYTFDGWDRFEDPDGNVIYSAKWKPVATPDPDPEPEKPTYTVTYLDPATGRIIQETVTVDQGDPECDAPKDPTRDGYTFDGWDRVVEYNEDGTVKSIVYLAKWKEVEKPVETPVQKAIKKAVKKTPIAKAIQALKTGDDFRALPYILVLVAAAVIGVLLGVRKRRSKDQGDRA